MKMYTNSDQTAKLIELGFEKPKGWYVDGVTNNVNLYVNIDENPMMFNYYIGELIEMLPQYLEYKGGVAGIPIDYYSLTIRKNVVMYCDPYMDWVEIQCDDHKELIDNLYDMVTVLKEEGVI